MLCDDDKNECAHPSKQLATEWRRSARYLPGQQLPRCCFVAPRSRTRGINHRSEISVDVRMSANQKTPSIDAPSAGQRPMMRPMTTNFTPRKGSVLLKNEARRARMFTDARAHNNNNNAHNSFSDPPLFVILDDPCLFLLLCCLFISTQNTVLQRRVPKAWKDGRAAIKSAHCSSKPHTRAT